MPREKPVSRHDLVSHERRVRRAAARWHLSLLKDPKPFGKVAQHGGYMLRMDGTPDIVFGNTRYKFDADLEDIERYLEQLEEREESER